MINFSNEEVAIFIAILCILSVVAQVCTCTYMISTYIILLYYLYDIIVALVCMYTYSTYVHIHCISTVYCLYNIGCCTCFYVRPFIRRQPVPVQFFTESTVCSRILAIYCQYTISRYMCLCILGTYCSCILSVYYLYTICILLVVTYTKSCCLAI